MRKIRLIRQFPYGAQGCNKHVLENNKHQSIETLSAKSVWTWCIYAKLSPTTVCFRQTQLQSRSSCRKASVVASVVQENSFPNCCLSSGLVYGTQFRTWIAWRYEVFPTIMSSNKLFSEHRVFQEKQLLETASLRKQVVIDHFLQLSCARSFRITSFWA